MTTQTTAGSETATQRTLGGRRAAIGQRTLRKDAWWRYPLTVWIGLGAFVVYVMGEPTLPYSFMTILWVTGGSAVLYWLLTGVYFTLLFFFEGDNEMNSRFE